MERGQSLNLRLLQRTVASAALKHLSEVPTAVLDIAGKAGRADDMTAVAVRLAR
jgi:autonomous glycyl radical cofactor GrcA